MERCERCNAAMREVVAIYRGGVDSWRCPLCSGYSRAGVRERAARGEPEDVRQLAEEVRAIMVGIWTAPIDGVRMRYSEDTLTEIASSRDAAHLAELAEEIGRLRQALPPGHPGRWEKDGDA
jgi:hypothetical protein